MKKTAEQREGKGTEAAGAKTRSVLATTLSSSCLAVSAVAAPATVPQNLVEFTDYPVSNVLEKLVMDKTTGRRLTMGGAQCAAVEIAPRLLSRKPSPVMPRVEKSREAQGVRTKKNAEVFTPSWLCRKMVDYLEDEFISTQRRREAENDSHVEGRAGAPRTPTPDWRNYVDTRVLEITCGEAPFIVSRYDATTGMLIPVKERIGLLDRKLRAVNENAADEEEWMKWAVRAYESVYGYEYQGDSLVIARANLLITFAENLEARWGRKATKKELTEIANRIVWNFWQMDGLKGTVTHRKDEQLLPGFEDCEERQEAVHGEFDLGNVLTQRRRVAESAGSRVPRDRDGVESPRPAAAIDARECVIFDWRKRCKVIYNDIGKKEAKTMKFDYAIGNPPYQEETDGTCTSDKPIYNLFIDESYKVADKVELITPARFLFNAGATPKAWNRKMLDDPHLKVLEYKQKSGEVFANTSINGGVAITYHDANREFKPIGTFTSFSELNSIMNKVEAKATGHLSEIISNRGQYRFSSKAYEEQPEELKKTSDPRISTGALEEMPALFPEEKPDNGFEYFRIYGKVKGKRVYRWFRKDYCKSVENLTKYKVFIAKADGAAGQIGTPVPARICGRPTVEEPGVGSTETFISIGAVDTRKEAEAIAKYVRTRFARTMLGVLKITQDNTAPVWRYVPLQDFTSASDIDWSKSVKEIDGQLYKKYKLSKEEIKFIEEKVKAME